jgi:hypothetical protein
MLFNLGTEGMAAEDGPRFSGRSLEHWGHCTAPLSTPSGPTEEGVCYWLTRLNRHHGDTR